MSDPFPKEITRRGFITKVGQGLVAANLSGTFLKRAAALEVPDPPGKKLGWAIVGLGSLAINQILPAFAKCEKSKVVALVSGHPDKANKLALRYGVNPKNIYNYQNYDAIQDNLEADIIYIVLPNGMHAEYTAGGGSLMDIGIYSLNASRYLTGEEPTEVNAMMYTTPGDVRFKEVEETINFQLRFPSGILSNCTSSYGYSGQNRYRVVTTKGWFELEPATIYSNLRMHVHHDNITEERLLPVRDHFALEMDHMSSCVMENKEPLTPGEEGLRDLTIMMGIYEAARTGKTVKL